MECKVCMGAQKVHGRCAKGAWRCAEGCAKVHEGARMCAKRCARLHKGAQGCANVHKKEHNSAQKVHKVCAGAQKVCKGAQVCAEVRGRVHRWGRSPGRVGRWCGCGGCGSRGEEVNSRKLSRVCV